MGLGEGTKAKSTVASGRKRLWGGDYVSLIVKKKKKKRGNLCLVKPKDMGQKHSDYTQKQ